MLSSTGNSEGTKPPAGYALPACTCGVREGDQEIEPANGREDNLHMGIQSATWLKSTFQDAALDGSARHHKNSIGSLHAPAKDNGPAQPF